MMSRALPAALSALAAATVLCCSTTVITKKAGAEPDGGAVVDQDGGAGGEDSGEGPELTCPSTGETTTTGTLSSPDITEASGIVASALNEGVYWVHNDSGASATAFALSREGKLLATLTFDALKPRDIEDIAIEDESPDRSFLYVGDIGDNAEVRTQLTIHRVAEPKVGASATLTATSEKMTVTYADGAHNAETLLFDPATKDLLIATKALGGPSFIHRIGPFSAGKTVKTEKIATVDVDLATGGEISRDGRFIAIRNYSKSAFVWMRAPGESVAEALTREPCKFPVAAEAQGEAFAFLVGNKGYVTVSEGLNPALHVTPLP